MKGQFLLVVALTGAVLASGVGVVYTSTLIGACLLNCGNCRRSETLSKWNGNY